MKRCCRCKEIRALSCFSTSRCRRDGLQEVCKLCVARRYAANATSEKARVAAYRSAHVEERRAADRAYRAANLETIATRDAAYYRTHREEKRAYDRQYYKDHREEICTAVAAWRANNPDWSRDWRSENRDKARSYVRNRRARLKALEGSHSDADVKWLFTSQRGRCVCCKCSLRRSGFHVDHVVAVSNGGSNDRGNLQLLCPTCNRRKHNKDPLTFMQQNGYLL